MKPLTAYLTAAGVTGEALAAALNALSALQADAQADIDRAQDQVKQVIAENQQARALAAAFRDVAKTAGVDLSELEAPGLSAERRQELWKGYAKQLADYVSGSGAEADAAAQVLAEAGFDLETFRKAGKDKRAELTKAFVEGIKGDRTRLADLERSQAFTDLNVDPRKGALVLQNRALVKGKAEGEDAPETYGVQDGETFIPFATLAGQAGFTLEQLAPPPKDSTTTESTAAPLGAPVNGGQKAPVGKTKDDFSWLG